MNAPKRLAAVATCLLMLPLAAQEKGMLRAASTTAKGITGDVAFSDIKISLNFSSFALAQIRTLTLAEAAAAFNAAPDTDGNGNLYRTSIPAEKRFLHKNTLCGSEETQWVATFVSGRSLQLAFFSGAAMPSLTPEALANTTSLCGTFSYIR